MKTIILSNSKKLSLAIKAIGIAVILILSTAVQTWATNYYTIDDGDWTSSSTWQNGQKPTTGTISSSHNIYIRHTIDYNSSNEIFNNGTIIIEPTGNSTAKLIIPDGVNIHNESEGEIYVNGGYFLQYRFIGGGDTGTQQDGNFYNRGYLDVRNSVFETSQSYKTENNGEAYYLNSCIFTGQNYQVQGSNTKETYINVNISIGWHGSGDFQLADGEMVFDDLNVQLAGTSGNFQLSSGKAHGDISFITFKNHLTNNTGDGTLEASSSLNNSPGLTLDKYWTSSPDKYKPEGKFSGNQQRIDHTSNYFPADCAPGSDPTETDMTIVKTASPDPVVAGETLTFTIVATNISQVTAENVTVSDVLPTEVTLDNADPSMGGWSGSTWTIGTMTAGQSETLTITTTVKDGVTGTISNTAEVETSTPETDYTNNSSTDQVTVNAPPKTDMTIVKTASPDPVVAGGTLTFTIVATNISQITAENVSVSDVLPSEVNYGSATPSMGNWSGSTWTIGTLTAGQSETLTITTTVKDGVSGTISNTAIVSTTTPETDYTNNTSTALVGGLKNYFHGTLAYEDLWPGKGDYDFNDLVLDYEFEINSNATNHVNQVTVTFIIEAFGAGLENGFGFQLSDQIDANDLTVTGYELTENYISLNGNGTEQGQSKPTIIVYDNAFNQMQHPGSGIGINTHPPAPYVTPDTLQIIITFPANKYTLNDLHIEYFNPFLIVNQTRGHEIHLPDYLPTDLVDESIFATFEDDSDPGTGRYYRTANNLPWGIHIMGEFDYPIELLEISTAHLHFIEWAESNGGVFQDWYLDKAGYRNDANIYPIP